MEFINFSPNPHPQVGYKIGIGWCVWLGEDMIAAGFEDQALAHAWAGKVVVQPPFSLCDND